ncbi:MAG TPA: serine hydrolase domain-containing protein, partial [Candidatus Melainabacteria bacterium]|nr:serine hydrolase domain-containing protein [Candidatus Melainabacteria bacterium]
MAIVSKTGKTGKALENKLQVYFDACISAFDFSGAAAISKDGKRIWTGIAGHANLEHGVPNTENTKFRLASVTKPFTAIAILQLQEKGKLKISDPISKYFKKAPRNWKGITIQNLLTHTSGIPSYTDFPEFDVRKRWTPTEIVETVIARPLDFKPGEKFYYCNTGYVLLGIVIESVSGKTYEEYLRDHIFKPSGMRNSGVDNNTMVLKHRAQGYRRDSAQRLDNANYLDMSFPFSAGSLYSTLEDLLRFDTALSGGKLLKQSTIEAMLAPGEANYALGWTVEA